MANQYHQMSDFCSEMQDHRGNFCGGVVDIATQCLCDGIYCLQNNICCCWLNIFCCHCNCAIFPGSSKTHGVSETETRKYLNFQNKAKQSVPYIELSSEESLAKNKVIIYFHGNSQNIVEALCLAEPIFNSTQITTLLIEYPTYASYVAKKTYDIAKQIMSNSLEFYKRVCAIYNVSKEDIYIVGRSIGSGPACHLAAAIDIKKLALISPFDSISAVAKEKVGDNCGECISLLMHDHFNNIEQMKKYKGELMVIHGKNDEVISIQNATNLVKEYQGKNRKCEFIQPPLMTHNYFKTPQITDPIKVFFN